MKTTALFKRAALTLLATRLAILLSVFVPVFGVAQDENSVGAASHVSPPTLTYKIIGAPNGTFGYSIYANERLIIHQPCIPAIPGNNGFKSQSDAAKVAQLAITKIRQGQTLPTITVEEMKKLQVIN